MEQRTPMGGLIGEMILIVLVLLLIALSPLIIAHVTGWLSGS